MTPTDTQGTNGFNIYGNTTLNSGALTSITLEANTAASDPINVASLEGSSIANAVIDLQNSASTHQVVIGAVDGSSVSANHTVIGGSKGDTIIFGANAGGSNVAKAGSGSAYMADKATRGQKTSLIGGAGNDTILAAAGDYVEGGAGADFFYDSAAYLITDYNASEDGDVIVASKLSSSGITDFAQLNVSGNVIQVNGGARVTLGSEYDETTSMSAIVAGVGGANQKYVAWASD